MRFFSTPAGFPELSRAPAAVLRFRSKYVYFPIGHPETHIFTTKYAIFAKPVILANHDAKIYYKNRLEFNIQFVLARPRPRNKRFYTTKIDFSDSDKKSRVDLGLEQPETARNRKI